MSNVPFASLFPCTVNTLQRYNTKNSKQIFPKGTARLQSQLLHLWAIYILASSVCLFCSRKIGGPNLGIQYIDRSQTHECGNWDWGRAIPFLGIDKSKFLCNAHAGYRKRNWRAEQDVSSLYFLFWFIQTHWSVHRETCFTLTHTQ
jgi:hypothetical protein